MAMVVTRTIMNTAKANRISWFRQLLRASRCLAKKLVERLAVMDQTIALS
jgi:hypothetical protein